MMLHPNVQDLTNDKVNRYKLVIAAAKCARHITQKANDEREFDERNSTDGDRLSKDSSGSTFELVLAEKPVSIAVNKLSEGEYRILD